LQQHMRTKHGVWGFDLAAGGQWGLGDKAPNAATIFTAFF